MVSSPASRHLLLELHGCDPRRLNDPVVVATCLEEAAVRAGATIVDRLFHRFSPQGVTGVVVVEESHFSVHTWPEHGYAAADFFTCGACTPERAVEVLVEAFGASHHDVLVVDRGQHARPSLSARSADR